jgi:hypothetical protein
MMMECLGLSFVNRKVTKVTTNTTSIHRLARRSGIAVDLSLRLSLYKTKAQAKREHRNYHSRRAQAVVKKSVQCKRSKCGWHTKLLKRQQQLLQQDSARAGIGVLLWPILLGHNNSDPFPNSPLFPRDLSRDRGASPQAKHKAQGEVGVMQSEVGASSSTAQAEGGHAEDGASSSAQENNGPQGVQASSASSSARADNTLLGGQAGATSSAQGGDK